jgi:uncharacterized protein (TIGR03067 family)
MSARNSMALVLGTMILATTIGLGLLPITWAGEKDDAVANDMKLLEGDWSLHAFVTDGKEVPADKIQNIKLTIKGDRYLVDFGKQKMELRFKIDPGKKPKAIDLINVKDDQKVVTLGIYEISPDSLKLCRGTEAGQARPTEFAAKEGTKLALAVYKRAKK